MENDLVLYWSTEEVPVRQLLHSCISVMCLEEKHCRYISKHVSNEEKKLLSLDHRGEVPVLQHGELIISTYQAVCDYVEECFKNQGTQLIPLEIKERVVVVQKMYEATNLMRMGVLRLIRDKDFDTDLLRKRKTLLLGELGVWENYLKKFGDGAYITGRAFTMADIHVCANLMILVHYGLKLEGKFPHLASYYERVTDRPSVKKAWPEGMKSSPAKDLIGYL